LKEGVDLEILSEMIKKITSRRENLNLKQQKKSLSKELRKIQSEMDEINHQFEIGSPSGPQTPKDEDKKHKRSAMTSSGETKIIREKSPPDHNGKKEPPSTENKKKDHP
jgi:hypothetical protein